MSSIKVEMDQHRQKSDTWTEMIQKTVDTEVKASLYSPSTLRDLDLQASHGRRSVEILKSNYKEVKLKNFRADKLKTRSQFSAPQQSEKA